MLKISTFNENQNFTFYPILLYLVLTFLNWLLYLGGYGTVNLCDVLLAVLVYVLLFVGRNFERVKTSFEMESVDRSVSYYGLVTNVDLSLYLLNYLQN